MIGSIVNHKRRIVNSGEFDDVFENVEKRLHRRLVGVDAMDQFPSVVIDDWLGFLLVDFQALPNDIEVGIIKPGFLNGAALHASDQVLTVGCKIKHSHHIERIA